MGLDIHAFKMGVFVEHGSSLCHVQSRKLNSVHKFWPDAVSNANSESCRSEKGSNMGLFSEESPALSTEP